MTIIEEIQNWLAKEIHDQRKWDGSAKRRKLEALARHLDEKYELVEKCESIECASRKPQESPR